MGFLEPDEGALDYSPCHYGALRLAFRGLRRDLRGEYVAMLGGSETYGRFVAAPFPALVEEGSGIPVANLDCQNAGPDVYLADQPPPAGQGSGPGSAPWLIDCQMLEELKPLALARVEVVASAAARAEGLRGMRFPPADEAVARRLPGAAAHREAAQALLPVIKGLL